jgi:SPFH domain / Band 7 family
MRKTLITVGSTLGGIFILLMFNLVTGFPFHSVAPNAGQEAVLIDKPFAFGHGGVRGVPVKTGRTWVWFSTSHEMVNMLPQQHQVHFDDLMSSDGVPLDFDAVIRLQVTDSVKIISTFGPKWYDNNVEKEFANRVRQSVRKHGMNETAISSVAIDDIDREITEAMNDYLKKAEIPVKLVQVTVGKANPPDSVKSQRIETAAQEQRINTERQRKLAEDSRLAAEQSRAAADNGYRNALGLSISEFLTLEAVKMQRDVCGKEKSSCTFVVGSGAQPVPVVNVGK